MEALTLQLHDRHTHTQKNGWKLIKYNSEQTISSNEIFWVARRQKFSSFFRKKDLRQRDYNSSKTCWRFFAMEIFSHSQFFYVFPISTKQFVWLLWRFAFSFPFSWSSPENGIKIHGKTPRRFFLRIDLFFLKLHRHTITIDNNEK